MFFSEHPVGRISPLFLAVAALTACDGASGATDPVDHARLHRPSAAIGGGNSTGAAGLAQIVKAASSRYHTPVQATRAGYVEDSPCVAVPGLGTMGFHWVKHSLVDPVFNPLEPEAVLYLPDEKGKLRLVALEYIVIDVGQPRPSFDGYPFDVGGAPIPVDHWTLHAWVHEANPEGLHAPFNPALACP